MESVRIHTVVSDGEDRAVQWYAMKIPKARVVIGLGVAACALLMAGGYAWTVTSTDPFTLGEYYFNADDDPAGPYDLKKARFYYEEAIRASSTAHDRVWYQLGRIDFLEGSFAPAIAKFNTQIELFGDAVPNVYYMIGLTYGYRAQQTDDDRDWQRGEEAFKKFMEYEPEAPWPRVDLAWIYFMQGKYEDMLPVLFEGLQYAPENAWLHNMYGLALLNTGERERAHEHFLLALKYAEQLTVEAWGQAYPGNDPAAWPIGLESFREAIRKNIALTE